MKLAVRQTPSGAFDNGGWGLGFWLWITRPEWWRKPRMLIRAAPTCTLYRYDPCRAVYFFRCWPRFFVTAREVYENGR